MGKSRKQAKPLPKQRGPRGEGSVFPDRRRGGYRGKVPVGRFPDGRTKYKEVWGASQAECVAKKRLVLPPGPEVTVGEWAARWLAGLTVRASTRAGYERQVTARIVPDLGAVRVADLTVSRVKAALVGWKAAGVPTANRTLNVGATMLAAAVLDGIVARNPFADCPRLAYEPPEVLPFAPDDLKALIANRRYTAWPILAFLAATGCRIGEAAALDVPDYDPAAGTVAITKTWSRDHGTRAPKSRHSRRTITVPAPARAAVEHARAGRKSGILFRSAGGTRFDSAQLHIALNRLLKRLDLPPRGPHAIRHSVATVLVSRGVPLGDAAKFLGHTVSQLVKRYVRPSGADPADTLAAALA